MIYGFSSDNKIVMNNAGSHYLNHQVQFAEGQHVFGSEGIVISGESEKIALLGVHRVMEICPNSKCPGQIGET